MLNITNSYAKIWNIEDAGNYVKGRISTSRKDKRDDSYINSNWLVRFVGTCVAGAKTLKEGDKIKITNGIVENVYNAEQKKNYTNLTVFELEKQEGSTDIKEEEDDLPF